MVNHNLFIPKSAAPYFTVDTTKDFVELTHQDNGGVFQDSNGYYSFQPGDNVYITSCGVMLPFGFHFDLKDGAYNGGGAQSEYLHPSLNLKIGYGTDVATLKGLNAALILPAENLDVPLDIFTNAVDSGSGTTGKYCLFGYVGLGNAWPSSDKVRISMAGVPATLQGKKYYAFVYLRAASNFGTVDNPV